MSKHQLLCVLTLATLSILNMVTLTSSTNGEDGKDAQIDAEMTLEIPATSILGSPLMLAMIIENRGDYSFSIASNGRFPETDAILTNIKKNIVVQCVEGAEMLSVSTLHIGNHRGYYPIPPGEKKSWKIDLQRYYKLEPGEYEFRLVATANFRDSGQFKGKAVRSQTVKFVVTK